MLCGWSACGVVLGLLPVVQFYYFSASFLGIGHSVSCFDEVGRIGHSGCKCIFYLKYHF
jgi:hypothetical protein